MNRVEDQQLLEALLTKQFPQLADFEANPSRLFSSRERAEIKDYRRFFEELSPAELEEYARRSGQKEPGHDEEEIENHRPFNQPCAAADFDHWTRQAIWSLDEANALLLGRDPNLVKYNAVRSSLPDSKFAREYSSLRQTLKRAEIARVIRFPGDPKTLLDWAQRVELPLPEQLIALVVKRHAHKDWWRKALEEKDRENAALKRQLDERNKHAEQLGQALSTLTDDRKKQLGSRERETFNTMIIAMAIKGYCYDPQAERSTVPREIVDDILKVGLTLSDETVRMKLKEAAELLPVNFLAQPQIRIKPNQIRPQ